MKFLMKYLTLFLVIVFLGFTQKSISQTLVGAQIDNRAGIRGLTLNPANVINPRLKAEVNVFTFSGYFGNDYIGVSISDISKIRSLDELSASSEINAKPDNNFVGNVDILGPSFQMNLSPKHSIAISTRVRTFFNLNNIGGEFLEAIYDNENDASQFEVLMRDVNGITHLWGEIGGTYGRVLLDNESVTLKGAATLKYLFGAGGVTTSSETLGAVYFQVTDTLTTAGQLDYGFTDGVESGEISFGSFNSGFGVDLGAIFEIKDKRDRAYGDGYVFRGGISVMDIGGINYKDFSETDYNMNARIALDEFDDKSIEEVLDENYQGSKEIRDQSLAMPTSLQIFGDFALTNKFYLSAHASISLRDHKEIPVSKITNNISVTPRFESGWIAVYSPLSYRQYEEGLSWGLGVRLGPVILGSGSLLTNILSKNSRSTDAYFGLQIPIYNKGRRVEN
ncbi:DUF5723 family protein [Algoriphagus sediminis]|uniref:DUF5723 family protein n=1 Tax=Algoriphagus sediminis TaxID=3057113 RepID=A0ABT7YGZ9_9BACT|nr:DUF5723 family protein [Algoriphagus sediminis]MDN3205469.1 DUF5723 family protein [Algoriphagus sediminis]